MATRGLQACRRLERDTSNYPGYGYHPPEVDYEVVEGEICAIFEKFGGQGSHFILYLNWDDIELALKKLVESGHPSAMRLQKARDLAQAIDNYVATDLPPQSN